MLSHNSAAYHPTISQRSQSDLLSLLIGRIMQGFFENPDPVVQQPVIHRAILRAPVHPLQPDKVSHKQEIAARQEDRWAVHISNKVSKASRRGTRLAIKTHLKRTVFTKKKQSKIRKTSNSARVASKPLALRGLNIQWPFSQLLLNGTKTMEIRKYSLGYLQIARAGEELWLVETLGKSADPQKAAQMPRGVQIGPRPREAQIIGTITFSKSTLMETRQSFDLARPEHCIKKGSPFDWSDGCIVFGWRVAAIRKISVPVDAPKTKSIVGFKRQSFNVDFD
jgi:hypothetical protein